MSNIIQQYFSIKQTSFRCLLSSLWLFSMIISMVNSQYHYAKPAYANMAFSPYHPGKKTYSVYF